MLQFRGRGIVALELPADAIAIKVTDDQPTLICGGAALGWVGRLVPHGERMPGAAPFQLGCQGEGRGACSRRSAKRTLLVAMASLRRELTNLPNLVTMGGSC